MMKVPANECALDGVGVGARYGSDGAVKGLVENRALGAAGSEHRAGISELDAIARCIRGCVVWMSHKARAAHLASALSCVDILVAAYWGVLGIDPARPGDPARDHLILST